MTLSAIRLLVVALLAMLAIEPATAGPRHGIAARYRSEQIMRRAAAVHGVEIPSGMEVCAATYHPLGTVIEVRSRRRGTVWRCVVGDVPHPNDRAAIVRRGIVVELTPRGAMEICGSVKERPERCPVTVEPAEV